MLTTLGGSCLASASLVATGPVGLAVAPPASTRLGIP
jgi:hypothetical protein